MLVKKYAKGHNPKKVHLHQMSYVCVCAIIWKKVPPYGFPGYFLSYFGFEM